MLSKIHPPPSLNCISLQKDIGQDVVCLLYLIFSKMAILPFVLQFVPVLFWTTLQTLIVMVLIKAGIAFFFFLEDKLDIIQFWFISEEM